MKTTTIFHRVSVLLLLSLAGSSWGEGVSTVWTTAYDSVVDGCDEKGLKIARDSSGNVFVAGIIDDERTVGWPPSEKAGR